MRWIDMSEREMIKAWAGEEASKEIMEEYLSLPNKEKASYWCAYNDGKDILEYDFNNVPEFKVLLEQELGETYYKDLILPLIVATFKEKKLVQIVDASEEQKQEIMSEEKKEFEIPEFVYVF